MDAFELIEKDFFDEFGPAKLIHIHEPKIGLKAICCMHNVAIGPAIGGVICGAVEYHDGREDEVFPTIEYLVKTNTKELCERVFKKKQYPREAALQMAQERIKDAMRFRFLH